MDIILDTNIIRSDLFFKSSDFIILKDYLSKTNSKFVLLKIVDDEINALYRRLLNESLIKYKKSLQQINKYLNESEIKEDKLDIEKLATEYNYFYKNQLGIDHESIVSYNNNILPEIIDRCINNRKPFKTQDKGFRDAVIWLTILDYLKNSVQNQLIFISNNSSDFGQSNHKNKLHEELVFDCHKMGKEVQYFETIKGFIEMHSESITKIDEDWIKGRVDEKDLVMHISDHVNLNNNRIYTWLKNVKGDEFSEYINTSYITVYEIYDISVYEMLNGNLAVNYTQEIDIEIEHGTYEIGHFGLDDSLLDQLESAGFPAIDTQVSILKGRAYIRIITISDKVSSIEVIGYDVESVM